MDLIRTLEQEEITRLGKKIPEFAAGDTVVVNVNVVEGNRKRVQAYEGVVIAKRNRGLNSSFIVRKISSGEGVERTFQTYSPSVASIEVKRKGDVRRAKLYYLRGLTGKAARIREKLAGADQSDYSSAILAGPFLGVRTGKWSFTASYARTVTTFDATTRSPGYLTIGYNANRKLSREDINVFASYALIPELSLFSNLKILNYKLRDAVTYINRENADFETSVSGIGLGLGVQIAAPFSDGSPLYTFTSIGAVLNAFKAKPTNETGSELVYFLDGGLGFRFLPTMLTATLGIRVENGKDSKTIIGPTGNLFFTI